MRVLIATLAVFFSAAALLVATQAFMLPARETTSTAGRTNEGEAKISAALQQSLARINRQQAASETTISELQREIGSLNDELAARENEKAIERLAAEQATHQVLVTELRRNILELENELAREEEGETIERLAEEQAAHSEEVRRLREELAAIQKKLANQGGQNRIAAPVPAESPRKSPVPEEEQPRREAGAAVPEEPPARRYPVATGAEEEGTVIAILGGGLFPSGEKTPSKEHLHAILETLPAIVVSPESLIVVEGHADSTPKRAGGEGTFFDNKALSLQRAEAIARLLEEEGIDPSRLAIAGYGDTRPLAPNTSEEGRAENRRVEIKLVPPGTASQQR
jgi:flagellar motor protein MotB